MAALFLILLLRIFASADENEKTLHIAALLPTGEDSRWRVEHADKACELAVQHVNEHAPLVDGYRLKLRTNSSNCDIGLASYQLCEMLSLKEKFVALIAEGCSPVTRALAQTTEQFEMLQFNFLSTSPSLYSRTVFPLYYPLLPAETTLNYARVQLLKELKWKDAIILIESEEVFNLVANHLMKLLSEEKYKHELYIVSADMPSTMDAAIENIANSDRRIIIGMFFEEAGRQLVCRAHKAEVRSPHYVWLFPGWYTKSNSTEWYAKKGATNCTVEQMEKTINGHFNFDFIQVANNPNVTLPTGKTRREVESDYMNMTGAERFEQYSAYAYDTVLSIAMMLNKTVMELKANGIAGGLDNFDYHNKQLRERFQKVLNQVKFDGLIGEVHFDSTEGDHETTEQVKIDYRNGSENSFVVGTYDTRKEKFKPNNIADIPWISGKVPIARVENVSDYSNKGLFYAVAILAGLGIAFALCMLTFNIRFRSRRIVKLSSPHLNSVIAIGAVLINASIIFDGFNGQFYPLKSFFVPCYFRNSLLVIGFSLLFGSMFAKTWRVSRIIKETDAGRTNSLHLTDKVLFAIVGAFVIIDVLLLSLWFGIDPFQNGYEKIKTSMEARYVRDYCSTPNGNRWRYAIYVYKGLVLILGAYLAYDTRRVTIVSLNDSRYIALSVYNTVIACIIVFALSFVPNPGLRYFLTSVAVIVTVASILCFVFVSKIYLLATGRDKNMRIFGRVATTRSAGVNDHTIARTTDLLALQGREKRKSNVIRLLLDNGHFPEEIIKRVKSTLGEDYDEVYSSSSPVSEDQSTPPASENELVENGKGILV